MGSGREPGGGRTEPAPPFAEALRSGPVDAARAFYALLREEVTEGNPALASEEQRALRGHYPVMLDPGRYPPGLAAAIYAGRRAHPVRAIMGTEDPVVLDAGCGFGSESFLFAAAGAKVLAVDISEEQIAIASKRRLFWEETLGRSLDVEFEVADLEGYLPDRGDVSLTWLASVLAAIRDQEGLLRRIRDRTRPGGCVMVTDMKLLNPLFAIEEWRRRQRGKRSSREFSREADFVAMFLRRGRMGARFYPQDGERGLFDDVQFFWHRSLSRLLRGAGFAPEAPWFFGFVPPFLFRESLVVLERLLAKVPFVRAMGYFYLVTGVKGCCLV